MILLKHTRTVGYKLRGVLHMSNKLLKINNLRASIGDKEILKGLNLSVGSGEIHVIMGPNGAGKSTLANILMGHPKYEITQGTIDFDGQLINDLKANERAKLGMFLSFQYPEEIPGITVENFLRTSKMSISNAPIKLTEFRKRLRDKMNLLDMKEEYATRYLNEGFSGGEKKKSEILQMLMLEPKLAILDETDSGLDVDAVRIVASGISKFMDSERSVIIITHHSNILECLKPDYVHVLMDGIIIKSGDNELTNIIERDGFEAFKP
jgi:Fe-S cluster assembly ATP-binding protein